MGIVKISNKLHQKAKVTSQAMSRSINAQAEHWMRLGQLLEKNPQLTYPEIIQRLLQQAEQRHCENPLQSEPGYDNTPNQ